MELLNEVWQILKQKNKESLLSAINAITNDNFFEGGRQAAKADAYQEVIKLIESKIKSNQLDEK